MSDICILFDQVTKDFKTNLTGKYVRAVDHVSLTVGSGKVYGLLGPNGSGKSTLMKMVLGLTTPSIGQCQVFGSCPTQAKLRQKIGYLPEAPYFQKFLTGREVVLMSAMLNGMKKTAAEESCSHVLDLVGMEDAGKRKVGTYSKGMLQRIGLAQAMVHDPDLLILDEPTAGVDPRGSELIARIVLDLKKSGKTLLLCSHLLPEVELVCDEVAILKKGKIIEKGDLSTLLLSEEETYFSFSNTENESRARTILENAGIPFAKKPHKKTLHEFYLEKAESELK